MRYGSVCSGVEAATLAWHKLGWKCEFVSEIEPFPCAVLHHRLGASRPIHPCDAGCGEGTDKEMAAWNKANLALPEWREGMLPNEGDFTKIIGGKYRGRIDLLVGGTPCQAFSVAGLRGGMSDGRGLLSLEFVRLAYTSGARWVLWENVPGCLSQDKGRAFASILSALAGCEIEPPDEGWRTAGVVHPARRDRFGLAWRVLDAQFTRVDGFPSAIPQRRRRVFVVGYFGDWRPAASVLFEPHSMLGDNPPGRKTWQETAGDAGDGVEEAGGGGRGECGGDAGGNAGADMYNGDLTGAVSMSVTSRRSDPHHVPCAVCTDGHDTMSTLNVRDFTKQITGQQGGGGRVMEFRKDTERPHSASTPTTKPPAPASNGITRQEQ